MIAVIDQSALLLTFNKSGAASRPLVQPIRVRWKA
jgi:hypothetical protein